MAGALLTFVGLFLSDRTILDLIRTRLRENIALQQKLLKELLHVSNLMQMDEPATIEDFTKLFGMIKKSHEKYFVEKRMNMERHLDRLGDFLAEVTDEPTKGGQNK